MRRVNVVGYLDVGVPLMYNHVRNETRSSRGSN
jgi:hypothetical protein